MDDDAGNETRGLELRGVCFAPPLLQLAAAAARRWRASHGGGAISFALSRISEHRAHSNCLNPLCFLHLLAEYSHTYYLSLSLFLLLPSLFISFSFSMLHRTLAPSASNPEACLLLPDDALISPLVNHSDATFCREIMVVGCFGWSGKSILFQGGVFARFPGYWKRFWSNIGLLLVDRRFKSFGRGKCKAEMRRSYTTGIVKMIVNLGPHNAT